MAKKISELPTMTTVTDGDYLIVNDGDLDTRKISFERFATKFLRTDVDGELSGNLTLAGNLLAEGLALRSDLLFVDSANQRIGIGTTTPEHKVDIHGNAQISNGGTLRFADFTNSYAVTLQAPILTETSSYALPSSRPSATASFLTSGPDGAMYWSPTLDSIDRGAQVVSYIATPPPTSGSPGLAGQMAIDDNYLYFCRADDVWHRSPIETTW